MQIKFFDPDGWREITASLARNKTRTFLTAFGIFWGTAMLALLMGSAAGFKGIMSRNFAGLNSNMGAIFPGTTSMSYRGYNKGMRWGMTVQDIEEIRRRAPHIEYSSPLNWFGISASAGEHSKNGVTGIGVEPQYAMINRMTMEGRFLNSSDMGGNRKVVVIGRNLAAELYPEGNAVGKELIINSLRFTVVGVAGQIGEATIGARIDDAVIMPSSTARRAFQTNANNVNFFMFTAPGGYSPADNFPAIRRVLTANHPLHPDDRNAIGEMDISETFKQISAVFTGISLLALFVGAGTLFAGVIGVGNIMWIVVKERTQEFGIRRAIGAKPFDITLQILCESILLTLIAGMSGVCFAVIVLGIVDHVTFDPLLGSAGFEMPFSGAIAIMAIFLVLGSAAGIIPAVKAMKIKPIEAMRDK